MHALLQAQMVSIPAIKLQGEISLACSKSDELENIIVDWLADCPDRAEAVAPCCIWQHCCGNQVLHLWRAAPQDFMSLQMLPIALLQLNYAAWFQSWCGQHRLDRS